MLQPPDPSLLADNSPTVPEQPPSPSPNPGASDPPALKSAAAGGLSGAGLGAILGVAVPLVLGLGELKLHIYRSVGAEEGCIVMYFQSGMHCCTLAACRLMPEQLSNVNHALLAVAVVCLAVLCCTANAVHICWVILHDMSFKCICAHDDRAL